jgi:hypothetical protein
MEKYMIGNVEYSEEELADVIDNICAINGIQNKSFVVDEDEEVVEVTCEDPSNGFTYTEKITFEDIASFDF